MKKKEKEDLKEKTREELLKMVRDTEEEIVKKKFDNALRKLKDVNETRKLKKNLARMKTFISMKEREENKEEVENG